jgi:hypothetical protein
MRARSKAAGSSAAHTKLVHDILEACGSMPGVIIGSNAAGRAAYVSESGRRFHVPYGWPDPRGGGPDILAAVAPLGRLVGLEAKTGDATTTREQRECHAALRAVGVEVHVVRTVEEARRVIAEVARCGV